MKRIIIIDYQYLPYDNNNNNNNNNNRSTFFYSILWFARTRMQCTSCKYISCMCALFWFLDKKHSQT